jgi:hypothetical protein
VLERKGQDLLIEAQCIYRTSAFPYVMITMKRSVHRNDDFAVLGAVPYRQRMGLTTIAFCAKADAAPHVTALVTVDSVVAVAADVF